MGHFAADILVKKHNTDLDELSASAVDLGSLPADYYEWDDRDSDIKNRLAIFCITVAKCLSATARSTMPETNGINAVRHAAAIAGLNQMSDAAIAITTPLCGVAGRSFRELRYRRIERSDEHLRNVILGLAEFPSETYTGRKLVCEDLARIARAAAPAISHPDLKFKI
ncbi:MAG: hypothetical protein WCT04_09610 [Planctomycetota bacterium]